MVRILTIKFSFQSFFWFFFLIHGNDLQSKKSVVSKSPNLRCFLVSILKFYLFYETSRFLWNYFTVFTGFIFFFHTFLAWKHGFLACFWEGVKFQKPFRWFCWYRYGFIETILVSKWDFEPKIAKSEVSFSIWYSPLFLFLFFGRVVAPLFQDWKCFSTTDGVKCIFLLLYSSIQ